MGVPVANSHPEQYDGPDLGDLIDNTGCSEVYEELEYCLGDHDRDWRKCQKEVATFRKCMGTQGQHPDLPLGAQTSSASASGAITGSQKDGVKPCCSTDADEGFTKRTLRKVLFKAGVLDSPEPPKE